MRNPIRSLGIAAVICAATAHAATAQDTPNDIDIDRAPDQESLMDIYQRALQNDPTVREAEANYLAQAEARPQARANILPSLSFSADLQSSYSENPFGAELGTGELVGQGSVRESDSDGWAVSLSQTLFDWGQFTQLKRADKIVAQAETNYEAARQELIVRVSETYFNVLAAEDTLASATAARESIARQLEQAQRRHEVGLIAVTDVEEAQAGFDQAVATEIQAEQALATSQEFLREIIGDYVADLAGPDDELPLLTPDPASAEQWVRAAMQQNLALVASRINADIAEDDITIQRAGRLPTVSLSARYNETTSESTSTLRFLNEADQVNVGRSAPEGYSWSLNLQVPLTTGGMNSSRIQQSVYQQRAALEAAERVARQTERETRDAYLGVLSEISRVRALRQAVESSRTALRATEAGFEVGTRTTVDVLASQNNLRQAETNYSRSRYDYILNVLRLKQAAGSLNVEDMQEVDGWLEQP